ncbi:MAG: hypothetical protein SCALA702_32000 [Melioribacteraceae bacterium]|nr:MAG: hypothetical protein SCALA702_32000 [Melioribacteraceae bacterium]
MEMVSPLLAIKDKFYAGSASFEEGDLEKNVSEFNQILMEIVKNDTDIEKDKIFPVIRDILNVSFKNKLHGAFAEHLDKETYFEFGKHILDSGDTQAIKELIYEYLDIFRLTEFLVKIYREDRWEDLIASLLLKSDYNFEKLFNQRVEKYPSKTLFNIIKGDKVLKLSWSDVEKKTKRFSSAIKNLLSKAESKKVAFLMENSPDMAQLDLACLRAGILNVMIPANSVPQHISYILNQSECGIILLSDEKQLNKIKSIKNELKHLKYAVMLHGSSAESWVFSFDEFLKSKLDFDPEAFVRPALNETCTVMYTSGTTGEPKGIMFSNMNIVYKRFCRAMAIPEIGEDDGFLCYLPLFHTFGRYFELTGSVFWNAEYSFMENPSAETMIKNMKMVNPSIFISIPKKWIQLYEKVSAEVDIEFSEIEVITKKVKDLTGGRLRWGLSAAGYLDPDIFMFFQKYGVELMSGFGMTEATGGITMTPPGEYIPNSLGRALPGISIKLAADGELLVKGNYVMLGYFGQEESEVFSEDGYFATGDIMKKDSNGFIEIIDRKKEIYKNIKGETVAPQKIENLFNDFDFVHQVFLVGDHRPFNTVLIFPDFQGNDGIFQDTDTQQKQDYFSTVIATVNKFLAPFERIVDFRIIPRPFTLDNGELTPKGTFKRKIIESNFAEIIEEMYESPHTNLTVDKIKVRVPNWFLREHGCLNRGILSAEKSVIIPKLQKSLAIEKISEDVFRIGNFSYRTRSGVIDLQPFLTNPVYWAGNTALYQFAGDNILQWIRQYNSDSGISVTSAVNSARKLDSTRQKLTELMRAGENSTWGIHKAFELMLSGIEDYSLFALQYISAALKEKSAIGFKVALSIMERPCLFESSVLQKEMFKITLQNPENFSFLLILRNYLSANPELLDDSIVNQIIDAGNIKENLLIIENVLEEEIRKYIDDNPESLKAIKSLFYLLGQFGAQHPTTYQHLRQVFVKYQLFDSHPEIAELALHCRTSMRTGFRNWLGTNQKIAVDMETGDEYRWKDVIITEEGMDEGDKERIINAITSTAIIREAIFLFSGGKLIMLNNIPPGGIWISHLRSYHDKSVYRVSVQTRMLGSFEIVLNLNKKLSVQNVKEEVNWLILAGSRYFMQELVEDFGGYWTENDLWSGKFFPGDAVKKFVQRETRKKETAYTRMYHLWSFFVWNAAAAYFNFWKLTGHKLMLGDTTINNYIIPSHDYQTGTKVVSFSSREIAGNIGELFEFFYHNFVKITEEEYPFLKKKNICNYIFSGLINAEGEESGIKLLKELQKLLEDGIIKSDDRVINDLNQFLGTVEENGFIPKQLYFAIKRFHRWSELNKDASFTAQASMLTDLYNTYHLPELEDANKDTRARFFLNTVFLNSSAELRSILQDIVTKEHHNILSLDQARELITNIESEIELTKREKYFLTRLIYPHLKPSDSAVIIRSKEEGTHSANLVVEYFDSDGDSFYIRKPVSPKEISRLHQLFIEANLLVNFSDDHDFLVAISERGFIVGGLFYQYIDNETVFMDKIVVSNRYRRKGVSEKLMNELFERLRSEKVKYVTTGFFRPEYFYRFGFKIEQKYSGLVRKLSEEDTEITQESLL